jgi:cobalt-zinc-cadmium efflux system membrane fusion protein
MFTRRINPTIAAVIGGVLLVPLLSYLLADLLFLNDRDSQLQVQSAQAAEGPGASSGSAGAVDPAAANSVELTREQLKTVSVEPVSEQAFKVEREAVGKIAFNDERSVQVFTPYQGRILEVFARAGDEVKKGQLLFTVDSPDLVQAESTLISTAGQLDLTTRALARARSVYEAQGLSQKDLQQAISDQQAAEGNYKAARDAMRIFGRSGGDIDRIIAERVTDSRMTVVSPISGRVTARNAAPGLLAQPGTTPAPYTVSDVSTVWMLANVAETDIPLMRLGQPVQVKVMAYPDRTFRGRITNIAASVDPSTHRIPVRSELPDPKGELRPEMFAVFVIQTGEAVRSPAVPADGVVREGDGTMTVWVTSDRHKFVKRTVGIGMQQAGLVQIVRGLEPGEIVATEGALLLSNMLVTAVR